MRSGETGKNLSEMIKKAISDGQITNSEYREILALADKDMIVDSQEQQLLRQLHALIENKTIKRVPD
jgi:hypothetical protein